MIPVNRMIIKACCLFLSAVLVATSLSACATSNTQRALQELDRMKADRYFPNRTQAEFVTAVGSGKLERAQRLLAEGARVDAAGEEGMTALYWAIAKQNLAGFRFLLEHGADPGTITRCRRPRWRGTVGRRA